MWNFNIGNDLDSTAGTLKLKGATGQITASDAQITGKVTATSGQIAGFVIDGDTLTGTNFSLDAAGSSLSLGSNDNVFKADGDVGIQLGDATFEDAPFNVKVDGVMTASAALITGSNVAIKIKDLEVDTPKFKIDTREGQGFIKFGENASLDSGAGLFVSESGKFAMRDDDGNEISFTSPLSIILFSSSIISAPRFLYSSSLNPK